MMIKGIQHVLLHSEKFKMNEEVGSFLTEKVSNLLLSGKVNSITVDVVIIEKMILREARFVPIETLRKYSKMESPSSTSILFLRVY